MGIFEGQHQILRTSHTTAQQPPRAPQNGCADELEGRMTAQVNSKQPFWNSPSKTPLRGRHKTHTAARQRQHFYAEEHVRSSQENLFLCPGQARHGSGCHAEELLCKGMTNEQAAALTLLTKLGLFPGTATGINNALLLVWANGRFSSRFFLSFFPWAPARLWSVASNWFMNKS